VLESVSHDGRRGWGYSLWYAWNVLGLDGRDIALHFGHQDGGELVRKLYGHPDASLARERVREAFRQAPPAPVPLDQVRSLAGRSELEVSTSGWVASR
jgi:hypothetical protein